MYVDNTTLWVIALLLIVQAMGLGYLIVQDAIQGEIMATDIRSFEVGAVGSVFTLKKQPTEKFAYTFNFTKWLNYATTLASVTVPSIAPVDAVNAPTLGAAATIAGDNVTLRLDGGLLAGSWATGEGTLSFTVTTADGQVKEVNCVIKLVDY